MSETQVGREPVRIAEIVQPLCGNFFGRGRCRAGSGNLDSVFSTEWATDTVEGWSGTNGTVSALGARGLLFTAMAVGSQILSNTDAAGSFGDMFRYVLVRGRLLAAVATWTAFYRADGDAFTGGKSMSANNQTALAALAAGDEFLAVFDATDSTDYATEWQGASLAQFRLDLGLAANNAIEFYSFELATADPNDGLAMACFNTRASCFDPNHYREMPEALLFTDINKLRGETITLGDGLNVTAPLFAAFDVKMPPSNADGIIWEQGDAGAGAYLGVTAGELVFRAGGGLAPPNDDAARLSVDVTPYLGQSFTILVDIQIPLGQVRVWLWYPIDRRVVFLGSAIAPNGFLGGLAWTSWNGGAIGTTAGGGMVAGESTVDFTGRISGARFYNNTTAPDLTPTFVLPLRFSQGRVADQNITGAPYVIPSLRSVSTSPTRINLSRSNENASGLGNRALVSFQFRDHPHDDLMVDPYLEHRDYDPFTRASFWSKWMVRNLYRYNMVLRVHEGYIEQALSDMVRREYILTNASGPGETGGVTLQGKDVLTLVEARKAQAPPASPGILGSAISDTDTTINVVGAVVSNYPASGTIRIDDELITYSAVADAIGGGIDFTVTQRGSDGTIAAAHDEEDAVQECVRYTNRNVSFIACDLMTGYGGIDPGLIDETTFDDETERFLSAYLLSVIISEPTPVVRLLSELQEQVGFYLWWDERVALIRMRAVRSILARPPTLSDELSIIEGTFTVQDAPRDRISRVQFHYNIRSQVADPDEALSYRSILVQADLPSKSPEQYGEQSNRIILGRWINSSGLALATASRIVQRYSIVPRKAKIRVDAKDRSLWTGDNVILDHFLNVDIFGLEDQAVWTIISAEEVIPGETVEYVLEDTTLYGRSAFIQSDGAPDYTPGADLFLAFIGDANGLLSDGGDSARIT